MTHRLICCLTLLCMLGCASKPSPPSAPETAIEPIEDARFNVDIRWTSYGIPHVKADDWGSLGYGFAYATVTDGICVFAREVASAGGTMVADFGDTPAHRASDIFHRALLTDERIERLAAVMSPSAREFNSGFVGGYNRFISDHLGRMPASCRDAAWVRPIDEVALGRMIIAFGIRYGLGRFREGMAAASPPGADLAWAVDSPSLNDLTTPLGIGSNAIAVGRDLTTNGRGILLGNPHYPWHGPARFHMIHATIPGVVDVMGASLLAGNFIAIGFNKDIAWTHTVSTAARFSLFELELNPDNPMEYRSGDVYLPMTRRIVSVSGADGRPATKHIVYFSHHGPIIETPGLAWSENTAYAIRDAIMDNDQAFTTYEALQTASTVAEIESAISRQGVFFVNTIAADRHGNAFYADISATPNITQAMLEDCRRDVAGLPSSIIVLDGSSPECEWQVDSRSLVPGNMPAERMPRATSTRYFTNSNDSYWLSNPDHPLEGFTPTIGPERTPRSLRTRAGLSYVEEQLAADGNLSVSEVQDILFSHRHFSAELALDAVLTLCSEETPEIQISCDVLSRWDRRAAADSRGTHIWTEFWESARRIDGLYEIPFDPSDAVRTPRQIAIEDPEVASQLLLALQAAQRRLVENDIPLKAAWGEVQFTERNGERIPVPGAPGRHGVFSFINAGLAPGRGYTPIQHGNSYVQVVTWNDTTVDAQGLLTYSQSPEPDSPHYSDQTRLYSRGEWIDLPFTDAEIEADPNLRMIRLTGN